MECLIQVSVHHGAPLDLANWLWHQRLLCGQQLRYVSLTVGEGSLNLSDLVLPSWHLAFSIHLKCIFVRLSKIFGRWLILAGFIPKLLVLITALSLVNLLQSLDQRRMWVVNVHIECVESKWFPDGRWGRSKRQPATEKRKVKVLIFEDFGERMRWCPIGKNLKSNWTIGESNGIWLSNELKEESSQKGVNRTESCNARSHSKRKIDDETCAITYLNGENLFGMSSFPVKFSQINASLSLSPWPRRTLKWSA